MSSIDPNIYIRSKIHVLLSELLKQKAFTQDILNIRRVAITVDRSSTGIVLVYKSYTDEEFEKYRLRIVDHLKQHSDIINIKMSVSEVEAYETCITIYEYLRAHIEYEMTKRLNLTSAHTKDLPVVNYHLTAIERGHDDVIRRCDGQVFYCPSTVYRNVNPDRSKNRSNFQWA